MDKELVAHIVELVKMELRNSQGNRLSGITQVVSSE